MGSFQDIEQAIAVRLATNWTTTPITYENVPYTPTPRTAFVRLLVNEVFSKQIAMSGSSSCHRISGLINIMIFAPIGTGVRVARGYADSIAAIFRNAQFSSILCRSPRLVRVGDIGEWYQYSVLVDFQYDQALANAI